MIIEFPAQKDEPPTARDTADAALDTPANRVKMAEVDYFKACNHWQMEIDDKQRTVKCVNCGIWLDPVWCLRELFHYYERRVDNRLAQIKEWEEREARREKGKKERKARSREYLSNRRRESLERAAYNEYQAKLLTIRADKQKATAAKLDAEIGSSDGA